MPAAQFRQVAIAIAPVAVLYVPVPQSVQAVEPTAENEPGAHRVHGTPLGAGLAKAPGTHVQSRMDMALLVRVALLAGHEEAFVIEDPLRLPHCCGVHVCELLHDTNTDKSKNTVPMTLLGGVMFFIWRKMVCLYIFTTVNTKTTTIGSSMTRELSSCRIRRGRMLHSYKECMKQKLER